MICTSFKNKGFRVFLYLEQSEEILIFNFLKFCLIFSEIFVTLIIERNSIEKLFFNPQLYLRFDGIKVHISANDSECFFQ